VPELGDASDAEGLRLITAFFRITDPQRRREVVALAEQMAKEPLRRALPAAALLQDNEPE
jgi:hypothetical protein